jgi:hypothetical protein
MGAFFGFVPPPPLYYLILAGILGAYALLAETVKRWFYKRYAHRVEQVLVPKRTSVFSSKTAKLMQDMVSVISLRFEDEISIDSLTDDLTSALTYPINADRMVQNLQNLRRSGLISIDWQKRTIKREKQLKEYVEKTVVEGELWSAFGQDWLRIRDLIQNKRGKVNAEYQELMLKKQK